MPVGLGLSHVPNLSEVNMTGPWCSLSFQNVDLSASYGVTDWKIELNLIAGPNVFSQQSRDPHTSATG